jgi:hypothetical protein
MTIVIPAWLVAFLTAAGWAGLIVLAALGCVMVYFIATFRF